ncbi:MAG: DUF2911 domain-containing protein, partial [Gemmatimonadales bacterium]
MSRTSCLIPGLLLLALAPLGSGGLAGQSGPAKGGFVVRLGQDTLAVERYTRSAGRLESDIVLRTPNARRVHYVASLAPAGTVSRFELTMEPLVAANGTRSRGVMIFRNDSADVTVTLGDSTRHLKVAVKPGAVPLAALSHAVVEQAILQARKAKQDSLPFDWLALDAGQAMPSYVTTRGKDSVVLQFFSRPAYARVDRSGRLLWLDGRETTMKVEVTRDDDVDLEKFAQAFTRDETAGGPMGQLSPRDTTRAEVGGAHLLVDYGRPHKRGREIFGGLVPWDQVWRTGANSATQLTTDQDLTMGGQKVPAGTYTLWTLPAREGAKLIINQQTRQWGTDYDPARDLVRVDLRRESLASPVEQFT